LEKVRKITDLISRVAALHGITISLILLFLLSFTYLLWFANGTFFFQENNSLFIYSSDYFEKFLAKPGGLIVYAGDFLIQGYFSPLYGSLINSILLIIICLVVKVIVKHLNYTGSFNIIWMIVPSMIMLIFQSHYDYYLIQTIGFLSATSWFLLSITRSNRYMKLILLILFPLFYFLTGTYALISAGMYLTYSIIYQTGRSRYIYPLILTVVLVLTIIIFYEAILLQPLKIILSYPLILYANSKMNSSLVALGILFILYPALLRIPGPAISERYRGMVTTATFVCVFTPAICLLAVRHNTSIERIFRLEKMVYRQDWNQVISHFEKDPSDNIIEQFYYHLALSEKDLLCERMFSAPQGAGPMSLSLNGNRGQSFRIVYYYYAIGLINEAHHLAYELMVQHGYTPENIKMLIKTELISRNFRVAERYLTVLSKTLHYRSWAQKYRKMLDRPELVNSDPELGEKIRLMPVEDFFILPDDAKNLDQLLKSNPHNRNAFEYKVAKLLLEKDLVAVSEEVKNMKAMGYTSIPRHIDEAVVALKNFSKETADLGGLSSDPDTEERFEKYIGIINKNGGNRSLIGKTLGKDEKNTFWYYLQFGTIKRDVIRNAPVDNSIY